MKKYGLTKSRLKAVLDQLDGGNAQQPDAATYASLLRQCAKQKAFSEGKRVHAYITRGGYERETYLGNLLVQMYSSCGCVDDARRAFDNLLHPNVFSGNIMLTAYAQNGHLRNARILFDEMLLRDVVSWNAMIGAYARIGHLGDARAAFDRMPEWDVVSWNAMITAYAQSGHLQDVRIVFDGMPQKNLISWNATIAAYAQNGHPKEALQLATAMDLEGMELDAVTYTSVVDACATLGALNVGKLIHLSIIASRMQVDVELGNALINMYGKCSRLEDAKMVFNEMLHPDLISWNTIIATYSQNRHGKEALQLFRTMDLEGIQVDRITLLCVLDACASIPALAEGKIIHNIVVGSELMSDVGVGTAVVDMYGKCGLATLARSVFDKMPLRNLLSWTAMLAAYAHNGHGQEALEFFRVMNNEGVDADEIIFKSILTACSHTGLAAEGWNCFVSMQGDYGIQPTFRHYLCMVDILGRAGQLKKAQDLVENMPFEPDAVAWKTFLAACKNHGNVEQAKHAAKLAYELDPANSAPYMLLRSSICQME